MGCWNACNVHDLVKTTLPDHSHENTTTKNSLFDTTTNI